MSKEICKELLRGLRDRLEILLDNSTIQEHWLDIATDLGYINALIDYNVFIESEDYEELLSYVRKYEAISKGTAF